MAAFDNYLATAMQQYLDTQAVAVKVNSTT